MRSLLTADLRTEFGAGTLSCDARKRSELNGSSWPGVSVWTGARMQPFGVGVGVGGWYDWALTQGKRRCRWQAHLGRPST